MTDATATGNQTAAEAIDAKIKALGDWRGRTLARVRELIHAADPEVVEEVKWRRARVVPRGHPVHRRNLQEGRKADLRRGAALEDPTGLFNSSLEGNVRRVIDIHEGETLDAEGSRR